MLRRPPEPSAFGELLDKFSGLTANTDNSLDQVKKSIQGELDTLRRERNLGNLATNLYKVAEKGFKKDLTEIGINGSAQEEYLLMFRNKWRERSMEARSREILASPELSAMDAFITDIANLPKLKTIMESAQPTNGFIAFFKGLADRFGLGEHVERFLGPLLVACGFKKETVEKITGKLSANAPATPTTVATPTASAETPTTPETPAAAQTSSTPESREALRAPGSTMILGDSINTQFTSRELRDRLGIDGKISVLAKGSQTSAWLLNELRSKPVSYFEGFENAVILIGTNDLGSNDSANDIWTRMEAIYQLLKEKGVKVHACTLPPGKGNTSGLWGSNFDAVEAKRIAINEKIRTSPLAHRVIDLAARRSEGGVADNADPQKLARDAALEGDPVHPAGSALAEIYQRELSRSNGYELSRRNA